MSIGSSNSAVLGSVDLWLANNIDRPSELRFFEAQSTSGIFPAAGTNYTAFKAQPQATDITYSLPASQALPGQVLTNDGSGVLSWTSGMRKGSGILNFSDIPGHMHEDLPVNVPGAQIGDPVFITFEGQAVRDATCFTAWVSEPETVTIRFNNYSAVNADPDPAEFRAAVLDF